MRSTRVPAPSELTAALEALDAAVARVRELNFDTYDPAVRLRTLERLETARRHQTVASYDLIASLAKEEFAAIGGVPHKVIADWLRISCTEARRRIHNAEQLAPRLTLTGQVLPPQLPATAQAWRAGMLDEQHLRVIQSFVRDLPEITPAATVEQAEQFLAEQAANLRPDQLDKLADRYAVLINPDGKFSDADRGRQRGFTWCSQRRDGMSIGKLVATPELRANLDAWMARFAAPGMCNPDDQTPCISGQPDQEAASKDRRSHAQRQHDALNAGSKRWHSSRPTRAPAHHATTVELTKIRGCRATVQTTIRQLGRRRSCGGGSGGGRLRATSTIERSGGLSWVCLTTGLPS
jgi:hypothetical protein